MEREPQAQHDKDWSLNLEDPYYAERPDKLLEEAADAVARTKPGRYVNIITPAPCGEPQEWLIPQLKERLDALSIAVQQIVYLDQCGCGGHVTRVYR